MLVWSLTLYLKIEPLAHSIFNLHHYTAAATIIHRRGGSGGVNVKDGLSAYELAVANGFDGSIQDWLDSLQGKSAYEVAKENGYTGSEEEWAKSLQATAGKDGESVKSASFSADGELLLTLSDGTVLNAGKAVGANGKDGKNGADGKDGIDGKNGIDGKDGIGVSSAKVNGGGQLILSFSDGSSVNLDRVVGMNGKDGIGIETSEIDPDGFLVLTYTNRQTARLGKVIGANGKDGRDGIDGAKGDKGDTGETGAAGADGISITSAVVNEAGELVLTYSNGSSANLGLIVGKDGRNGIDGTDGKDGANGKDGISVLSAEINSDGELVLSYSNGQRSNLGNVIGAAGKDGKDGKDGADGAKGETGETGAAGADGKDGIGVIKSEINNRGELVLTYSDNTVANLGVVVGANGKDGADGAKGEKGDTGAAGADGKDGLNGTDGKDGVGIESIVIDESGQLNVTLTNGTTLNLGNIRGADGAKGEKGEKGETGAAGADGKDGINGADGKDGIGISDVKITGNGELQLSFSDGRSINLGRVVGQNGKDGADGAKGETGEAGAAGADGKDGKDGADGVGIANVSLTADGNLTVTMTNSAVFDLGNVKGADGIGIAKSEINSDGHLVLTYSDGSSADLGKVVGANGANGADGADGQAGQDGKDGIGISDVKVLTDGTLTITMSDGTTKSLGNIKGEKGDKGDKGDPGENGKDGRGIAKTELVNGELVITYTDGTSDNLGAIGGAVEDSSAYLDFELLSDGTWKVSIKESVKSSIESVTIPSTYNGRTVSTIGSFTGCPNLMKVVLPNTIKTISNSAFSGAKFTSIDLPEGLETIGNFAFAQVKLTEIVIPDSAKTIGAGAFGVGMAPSELFASLEKVTIGNNVVFIGDGVFAGQTKLTSVTIPASVSKMVEPFRGCSGLKTVYFEDSSNWYAGYCMPPYTEIPTHPTDKNVSAIFADPSLAATELQRKTTDASRYAWYKTE